MADKAGRLEDRPERIRGELFPYEPQLEINRYLTVLSRLNFIIRYQIGKVSYITVSTWDQHQRPHHTEKKSDIPEYIEGVTPLTVNSPSDNGEYPPDSLIQEPSPSVAKATSVPGLVLVDSFSPTNQNNSEVTTEKGGGAKTAMTWLAYSQSYADRYGADPVRNATVNGQLANFVKRLGTQEAPAVAAFYVGSNRQVYVGARHAVSLMLRDAEGLRTEWATGRRMTDTAARQADKLGSNFQHGEELKRELKSRKPD